MKSLTYHFRSDGIDEFNKKIVEIERLQKKNIKLRKELGLPSSKEFKASSKFSGKTKKNKNKKNKKFWKSNQKKNWTGVYDAGKFLLITMKEDDLPQSFLERLTSNGSSWEKFKSGSQKLETLSRIIRNETLLINTGEEFISVQFPSYMECSLHKVLSDRNNDFFGEMKTTIWRKQGRISFNLSNPKD